MTMTFLLFLLAIFVYNIDTMSAQSSKQYMLKREELLKQEETCSMGGKLVLNDKEHTVNGYLMKMKLKETMYSKDNNTIFPPATHFFLSKSAIDKSAVYKFIQKMPKGGALHLHDAAAVDVHWLIKRATYDPHCYMCTTATGDLAFHFYPKPPTESKEGCSPWVLVIEARKNASSAQEFDQMLYRKMTLIVADPAATYPTLDSVWKRFMGLFSCTFTLFTYAPVFKDYYLECLRSFYEDNVHYLELRTLLPQIYELDGTKHDQTWSMETYVNLTKQFAKDHPKFIGVKIIFCGARALEKQVIADGVRDSITLLHKFPEMFAGYDLVGQEDPGHTLLYFLDDLLYPSQHNIPLKYFFHAGETDWHGLDVDENLLDAILLNTTRIGHGYAATKHPKVLQAIRERGIAIEVNPLSNQVLMLVKDLRNHPMAPLIAQDYPIVISSDDPALWGASPLSHDFYAAFMGLGGARADLRMLKQCAINSLKYSVLDAASKQRALDMWETEWDAFINDWLPVPNSQQ